MSSRPRIFVFTTSYYPFIGGAEVAVEEVAKRLSAQFDFFILTSRQRGSLPDCEIRSEGTVIRLGFGTRFDKWFLPFLSPLYLIPTSNLQPPTSILWGMDISQGSFAAAAAKWFFPRMPLVLTVQYGESEDKLRHGRAGMVRRAFVLMLRQADYLTAISRYLVDLSRRFGYCGPAELIHNGVDLEKFKKQNAKGKTTKQNSKVIITVSRLVPKNGVDLLIQAFAEVKKSIPNARLRIIGDGPERKNLELQVASYKLEADVEFLGEVIHDDLPRLLHEADVFVRPSRSEGMGNAFVEALAAGLPIIGTPVGGIPDIIEDGKTGLFVLPEDVSGLVKAIIRMLTDEELVKRFVRNGHEKVEREFDWDFIAGKYRTIFQQALDPKRRILIAAGLYPPEIGGPATYAKTLADHLPSFGVGVRIIPFRSVRRLPRILRHLAYFWLVLGASRGTDVIFAQDPVSVGLPALVAALLAGKKFVLKVVGDYAWEQYQQKTQNLHPPPKFLVGDKKPKTQNHGAKLKTIGEFQNGRYDFMTEMRRFIQRFVARRAVRIVVPSEYLKGIVVRWGVRPEKIAVIYNAFAPPQMAESKAEARRHLGIPQSAFMIVSAGRLVPWKGFKELIEAIPVILKEVATAHLFIIGSGPEEKLLCGKVRMLGLDEAVTLTGALPRDVLLSYFRAGDLFVLNSSYEGFSHILLEAMSVGIPILASNVGGNREIIEDGVNGILLSGSDPSAAAKQVLFLYNNPDLRIRLAQAAEEAIKRFGREEMLRKTASLLASL